MLPETKILLPDKTVRTKEKLAVFLAFIAGYTDTTGLIRWKTYVSFMSGNTTQLGAAVFSEKYGVIISSVIVISFFLAGIYTGTCLSLSKKFRSTKMIFYTVSGIMILYSITDYYEHIANEVSIAVIGFSMGLMNTIVTSVGNQKINTDFVTGTLNSLAKTAALFVMSNQAEERKEYRVNIFHLLFLWVGFLSGALVAPFLLSCLGNWTLIFPAALLLICALTIPIPTIKN
ncbi:YoaK family protein [uncultured Chryseobacterium sp.]|uniref:YoaK family protein n=1 Tax=uncultured Chryseobacterium sp. TaxID=259322 RepID=UPI00258557BF|nr:YoaK family protein [uncultured Chryseobacterium sp.]